MASRIVIPLWNLRGQVHHSIEKEVGGGDAMSEGKVALITGVTGQDGSFMADYLLKNTKHTIIAGVRRLSVKNHENISHLAGNPRFKLIDL